jgi:tetratricopeptide (TPR) repeat protein
MDAEHHRQFEEAVAAFRSQGPVRVSTAKIESFLDRTRSLPLAQSERLRKLAIALEHASWEEGWDGLRTLYERAALANPNDPNVFHSWGLSASEWYAPWATREMDRRLAIAGEAEWALTHSLTLAPRRSPVAHTLGMLLYDRSCFGEEREPHLSRAVEWFARAVEWDPTNDIAQLYLAHCHHDRKDWGRAVEEYRKVDQERLARRWPVWRAVKCREQLAHCLAWAGRTDEAVRHFERFLDEVESFPDDELRHPLARGPVMNVHELVDAVTHVLHHPELLRRTREVVRRMGDEKRHPELFAER